MGFCPQFPLWDYVLWDYGLWDFVCGILDCRILDCGILSRILYQGWLEQGKGHGTQDQKTGRPQQKRPVVANCSRVQRSEITTDYLLVDTSLSGMLSGVMVNDYNDFQHNYFSLD